MEKIKINTDSIKLNQFIKWAGITTTGSQASQIIAKGEVVVNSEKVLQRGRKLVKGDIVNIDGKEYRVD